MRKDTYDRVQAVLSTTVGLTAQEVIDRTGLSAPTVRHALHELADQTYERGAVKWTKRLPPQLMQLEYRESDNWPMEWSRLRMRIASDLSALSINSKSDPTLLAAELLDHASTLASIAKALEEVKSDPDWFAKLQKS